MLKKSLFILVLFSIGVRAETMKDVIASKVFENVVKLGRANSEITFISLSGETKDIWSEIGNVDRKKISAMKARESHLLDVDGRPAIIVCNDDERIRNIVYPNFDIEQINEKEVHLFYHLVLGNYALDPSRRFMEFKAPVTRGGNGGDDLSYTPPEWDPKDAENLKRLAEKLLEPRSSDKTGEIWVDYGEFANNRNEVMRYFNEKRGLYEEFFSQDQLEDFADCYMQFFCRVDGIDGKKISKPFALYYEIKALTSSLDGEGTSKRISEDKARENYGKEFKDAMMLLFRGLYDEQPRSKGEMYTMLIWLYNELGVDIVKSISENARESFMCIVKNVCKEGDREKFIELYNQCNKLYREVTNFFLSMGEGSIFSTDHFNSFLQEGDNRFGGFNRFYFLGSLVELRDRFFDMESKSKKNRVLELAEKIKSSSNIEALIQELRALNPKLNLNRYNFARFKDLFIDLVDGKTLDELMEKYIMAWPSAIYTVRHRTDVDEIFFKALHEDKNMFALPGQDMEINPDEQIVKIYVTRYGFSRAMISSLVNALKNMEFVFSGRTDTQLGPRIAGLIVEEMKKERMDLSDLVR